MGIITTITQDDFTNEKLDQIKKIVNLPIKYQSYNKNLLDKFFNIYQMSSKARWKGIDPDIPPESKITIDIADRVSEICSPQTEIPINERLRELLKTNRQEIAALKISEEIVRGKFGEMEPEEALKTAIRVGLAVVTEGVTVAPIQGLSDVQIRENKDGTKYACLFFAGPMRSAGGTESGFTVVLADHVRKTMNLSTYQPYSMGDDEPERILEELRMYERYQSFQFKVSDESLLQTCRRLPVEVNGVDTEQGKEVVTHRIRGEKGERITTNGLRGGALRVLNDGIIGRNKKLYKLIKELNISDWDWLENIQSDQDSSNKKTKESTIDDVISGRPVLSVPEIPGGFRLRYGRSFNTGHATIGINPASSAILGYPIVVGTQVKMNLPGKASTISFVDTIEGPRVVLKDGSLIQINTQKEAEKLKDEIKHIVYLGDILISYGDFLENNHPLPKSGYVEEIWIQELHKQWEEHKFKHPKLKDKLPVSYFTDIDFDTAIELSQKLGVPLHPKFLYYWDRISVKEASKLRTKLTVNNEIIRTTNDQDTKKTLELAGIPHRIQEDTIIITGDDCKAIAFTLNLTNTEKTEPEAKDTCKLLSSLCKTEIREKSAMSIGIRVGRPEKAMMRKQKPAVESIFPINKDGGLKSDILEAIKPRPGTNANRIHSGKMSYDKVHSGKISIDIANSYCNNCDLYNLKSKCDTCNKPTEYRKKCPRCRKYREDWKCPKCKIPTQRHSLHQFDLQSELNKAIEQVKYKPSAPFKGTEKLGSKIKFPEPLAKGLLRNKYGLSTYRDATIRYDVTNMTLTHASSRMINTKIDKLIDLGYTHDIHGKPLENEDQIFELFIQDIVIPQEAGETLIRISKFTDELLEHVYGLDKYYNFTENDNIQKSKYKIQDLIGELVVGLAPHTSVGIVGRVIGFTTSQVCFAHPYWHSAKRRDCDGDGDSLMLLMDVLLKFSTTYLPDSIGGLMDAPLLIQPIVLPKEVQRQARNLDIMHSYPKEFYYETANNPNPTNIKTKMQTTEEFVLSGNEKQFVDFHFTHTTSDISTGPPRTSYITDKNINIKIDKQLDIAKKIDAVDPNKVVRSLIKTHLIPDIVGNTRAYLGQEFRCKNKYCQKKARRMPLNNRCRACQGPLQATVTRGSALKYLPLAIRLCNEYDVGDYIKNRIELLQEEVLSIFPSKKDENQVELTTFI